MKRLFIIGRALAIATLLCCVLSIPCRADELSAAEKLNQARTVLRGERKDLTQAKKVLLDMVEKDKDQIDSQTLCYVYVYLGYVEDHEKNHEKAVNWYEKAVALPKTDRVKECAELGLKQPLMWIRHLDQGTPPPRDQVEFATSGNTMSVETAPPVIVKTVPMAGATAVDPGMTEIRVTFSKPMLDGSWSWSTWNEKNYPKTTDNPKYLADNRTCVLPVKLEPRKFYAIWLNSEHYKNFQDTSGRPAVPYLLSFFTGDAQAAGHGSGLNSNEQSGDQIDSAFVNDPQVLGEWRSVDFVNEPTDFNPKHRADPSKLYLKNMTFLKNGKMPQPWWTWSKGVVFHRDDKTTSHYEIKNIEGEPFLFFEWKSGDVTIRGEKPKYYVLAKITADGQPSFEKAVQTVIKTPHKRVAELLDLDTGARATSQHFGENDRETHEWIQREQLDLLGGIERGQVGLLCMDMVVAPAPTNSFENITPQEVAANWHLAQGWPKGINALTLVEEKTDTFFFRTREGGHGVLQILGQSGDPPGVKIQYRLLKQNKSAKWHAGESEKSQPNSMGKPARAVALFNEIENFSHEFDAVFREKNPKAAKETVQNFRYLLEDFNDAIADPELQFPAMIFEDITQIEKALAAGDWEKARTLAQHNETYARRFRAIGNRVVEIAFPQQLNADQRAVLEWIDRQFRSYFDQRTFAGMSNDERAALETRLLDQLKGPHNRDYYCAIGSLAALHSKKALEPLRAIAFDRADKDCRDRWMAVRALGILGDKESVPDLIHLVYHGNFNTRWWAQISLVRLTGKGFGKDWNAWGKWWNKQNGQPQFNAEIIRWWKGQPEAEKLAASLEESDQQFFEKLRKPSAN